MFWSDSLLFIDTRFVFMCCVWDQSPGIHVLNVRFWVFSRPMTQYISHFCLKPSISFYNIFKFNVKWKYTRAIQICEMRIWNLHMLDVKKEKKRKRNRNRSSDGFQVACMEYLRYLACFFFVCVDISSYCSHLLVSFVHTYGIPMKEEVATRPLSLLM